MTVCLLQKLNQTILANLQTKFAMPPGRAKLPDLVAYPKTYFPCMTTQVAPAGQLIEVAGRFAAGWRRLRDCLKMALSTSSTSSSSCSSSIISPKEDADEDEPDRPAISFSDTLSERILGGQG